MFACSLKLDLDPKRARCELFIDLKRCVLISQNVSAVNCTVYPGVRLGLSRLPRCGNPASALSNCVNGRRSREPCL